MRHALLLLILAFHAAPLAAQEDPAEPPPPISLAGLAAGSDLVALTQVKDTDYEYTRGFPSGGTAFLQVLIPYKVTRPLEEFIEVYEEGLHENECYFENPTVFEEGRRYLVFLNFSKDFPEQYNGNERGCALQVFVTHENLYALKYPVTGVRLADDFSQHAAALEFRDGYANVEEEVLSPSERDDLLERGLLIPSGDGRFRYTHGIDLGTARKLMGPDALTLDRALK